MDGKMSQNEIDILMSNFKAIDGTNQKETRSSDDDKNTNTERFLKIDFTKPNKLQYENLGVLKQIHEQFAKSLSGYLTVFLRCSIQADTEFERIEQLSYQKYSKTNLKHSLWGVYNSSEFSEDVKCFIQFEESFCNFFIDRSFGGNSIYSNTYNNDDMAMSDINKEVSKTLFDKALQMYRNSWDMFDISSHQTQLKSIEDNVQNLNLGVANSEMILIVPIYLSIYQNDIESDEVIARQSVIKFGIPYSIVEPLLDKLSMSNITLSEDSRTNEDVVSTVVDVDLSVEAIVGETEILFSDLRGLENGDIISFGDMNKSYDLYVNNVLKGKGDVCRLKNKLFMKISDLI